MTEQISIFTLNGISEDPLFKKIEQLLVGEQVMIQSYMVERTNKFYEIQNDEVHECFQTTQECCNYIDNIDY
ncbi:hypothetical protein MKZ08_11380 [Viridibacillus sp. FSL R5-0477]|uniref:Uncharacterized protein n=1 Tax=Viridibacillus arenosi FSL R5-213 TaxID=1227360 RepID=W4F0P1_9BACL|nr:MULTISPECIES: hypothetical protein [Viridibacillus]ETT86408.1 hypothetical protein C176_06837 [Viridibacillus arenosi FSL R5-213]OMC82702.1 hypothetical protein BK128_19925 [Viridibacillus sp. FSL H7-0596]OMC84706.1 hypothetical protein BK130_03570 [Viridibacillus sp. FSL H8-0123]OMC91752.1 hypothetical protein BK137_07505 [Viridibacillus arenosi]